MAFRADEGGHGNEGTHAGLEGHGDHGGHGSNNNVLFQGSLGDFLNGIGSLLTHGK
jgi:hypothetical protein